MKPYCDEDESCVKKKLTFGTRIVANMELEGAVEEKEVKEWREKMMHSLIQSEWRAFDGG